MQTALTYLKDYRPSAYLIEQTHLTVDLQPEKTRVSTRLTVRRNTTVPSDANPPLVLDGLNLTLESLAINHQRLTEQDYQIDDNSLTIHDVPNCFTLECTTLINPKTNTALVGLYQSEGLYCTQCEPKGFCHITYYLDRPDVLSEFFVTLIADKNECPVLLANGNLIEQGEVSNGQQRHWATWHDPYKKPSYLFAMVAGQLHTLSDQFVTGANRKISLRIFAQTEQDLVYCRYALDITKLAMAWDEKVYGREYDLDTFMIVAVKAMNVSGMENKGLNIYRADRLLVDPQITPDAGLQYITEIVAHEYFHNWSGNRVTCRDWFQLSLKEGFTTYRGFQFCHDYYWPAVKRIEETRFIRSTQFAEDASCLSHPIRPTAYRVVWNLFTATVYQKGAEVIRMLHTLVGPAQYRQGCDLFFQRHDGQAATTEQFIAAMADASRQDLTQFQHWYHQQGTPLVELRSHYKAASQQLTITATQHSAGPLLLIPITFSLIGPQGMVPFYREPEQSTPFTETVLRLTEQQQTFTLYGVAESAVPTYFRDFSAPVKWQYAYTQIELIQLLKHDPNGHSQWEASQRLWLASIKNCLNKSAGAVTLPDSLLDYYREQLDHAPSQTGEQQALLVQLLTLPSVTYLEQTEELAGCTIDALCDAQQQIKRILATALQHHLARCYRNINAGTAAIDPAAMASRALRNLALDYLAIGNPTAWLGQCYRHCEQANTITDAIAGLSALVNSEAAEAEPLKQQALALCYQRWRSQPLALNHWFAVQARCPLPTTLASLQTLLTHPDFNLAVPTQAGALLANFALHNPTNFHQSGGEGYRFFTDSLLKLIDINPSVASSILSRSPLMNWPQYDLQRQQQMKAQLQRLLQRDNLPVEVFDVVEKCLP